MAWSRGGEWAASIPLPRRVVNYGVCDEQRKFPSKVRSGAPTEIESVWK